MIDERAKRPRTQLVATDVIKIGTLPSCHVQRSDRRVAEVHAIIEVRSPAEILLIDLGARSGTFLNGKRVTSRQAQGELFRNGDEIKMCGGDRHAPDCSKGPASDSIAASASRMPTRPVRSSSSV